MEPESENGIQQEAIGETTWAQIKDNLDLEEQKGNLKPLRNYIIRPITINSDNVTLGPKTLEEWAIYETQLLHRIGRVIENKEEPSWEDLYFKSSKDFIAGIWTRNKENWQTLIAQMPEAAKALVYHLVMEGADIFLNLKPIERNQAVTFKNKKLCTRWKKHEANSALLKKLGGNMKTYINGRLRLTKHVPKPYEVNERGSIKALVIKNQESVKSRADEITQQLLEWVKMGSIEEWQHTRKPWLTAGFILVDREGKETRTCLNGSFLKPLEKYTFPCKLDSISTAIQLLKKGDVMVKFDDKKGTKS